MLKRIVASFFRETKRTVLPENLQPRLEKPHLIEGVIPSVQRTLVQMMTCKDLDFVFSIIPRSMEHTVQVGAYLRRASDVTTSHTH